jgi:hypothetical protein
MTGVRDAPGKSDNLRPELVVWGKGSEADFTAFGCLPDLCDPATVGALATLGRSAANDSQLMCFWEQGMWRIGKVKSGFVSFVIYVTDAARDSVSGLSEGEAWANLLLSVKP